MAGIAEARAALLEERERTATEIEQLQSRLAEIDAAIKPIDALLGRNGRTRPAAPRRGRRAARPTTTGRPPREGTMAAEIESFLSGQGESDAHADEILQHLEQAGRAPTGKNPKATVAQTLRQLEKRGRVTNVGRNRWRLAAPAATASPTPPPAD